MKILVLGGARFLGRHIVDYAISRGHELTLFNRGQRNPGLYPDVENLVGDRDSGLSVLEDHTWDAVIDTCGYFPRVVRASAEMLSDVANTYCFVSSVSVYADQCAVDQNEDAPVAVIDDPDVEEIRGDTYGALKALCEDVVRETFVDRTLVVRPGLIVGPHDPSDRFTHWVTMVAHENEVLVPDQLDQPADWIDGRDLGAWIVRMVESGATGTFNGTGPAEHTTMGGFLSECVVC
jgi:nucleoside-diphosphate-sugar epimerase